MEGNQEKIIERFKKDMDRTVQGLDPIEKDEEPYDEFAQVLNKVDRVRPKAFGKYSAYLNKTFTRIQLQFAGEMGIKLYRSTDFRNFVELPNQLPT